ncbi:recombinase family protein [Microvirga lotononidis]|uniref:Site-specific recombinase, DNA invertase Pin n=1 Tax=Microvirga lotononidis TaxID=864069 RepID=I4Z1Q5_9HYPH|nr:recombinase family protein [Microvirga lotononidis]EIM30147.1 site-specific recombinase, DNA invertase Pin [Microvirga lotononidis]EIM30893.1 site-specific recombinase, DNA invertase Pin [Microvirga lotononidis]WQO31819.1 recombinase family protein [Microvirga lotononidis]
MAEGRFVSYLPVSTAKQGRSDLGLEAQRQAVADYLNGGQWQLVTEVLEIESGKRADRLRLAEALRLCRLHQAALVIAKLDRLSRDAHFLLGLKKAGVDFVAADMQSASRLTVGIMAMVDEERRMISKCTKGALAAAKARAISLATRQAKARSCATDLALIIEELRTSGTVTLQRIAEGLNAKGLRTARGGAWSREQVRRVLDRTVAGGMRWVGP